MAFKIGARVKVTDYGKEAFATVTRDNGLGIVWVHMADTGRKRWFHASSLTRA